MFGVKVPAASDVHVEIRLSLGRGSPLVAWEGSADSTDADIASDILVNKNTIAYLWKAVDRGKIRVDDLGLVSVPARIVATQGKDIIVDAKANIPLTLPSDHGDRDAAAHQLLREMMAMWTESMGAIQKCATDAIANVSDHSVTAVKEVTTAHMQTLAKAHDALTIVAQSADKVSGLADKIFDDSRERAAALVHEARKGAQAGSKVSDGLKDLKNMGDVLMTFKAVTEDKDHGGKK